MNKLSCRYYKLPILILSCIFFSFSFDDAIAQNKKGVKSGFPVMPGDNGALIYTADSLGNRIPDFSYCGFQASEKSIPDVVVKVFVPPVNGDATQRIQSAINYVASLPLNKDGFRGAVLLDTGIFHVYGQLSISRSGIVLRGSGCGLNGTKLIGEGTDRKALIRILGKKNESKGNPIEITDAYVPVNTVSLHVLSTTSLKVGDEIIIHRPSTKEWIENIGAEHFGGGITSLGWKAGERDINFTRKITDIKDQLVTIDVPITTALDKKYGGGLIRLLQWPGRICNIGIENLRLESAYDVKNNKDESHRWMGITIENAEDAWVRRVVFSHFAGSAVRLLETSKRITVEDCKSLKPISEIGGERRYTFYTTGEQTLFQRCFAEFGYHDYAVGYCAPGPNAFVQCQSYLPYSFSGGIDSWASGILFDIVNVDGNALRFGNRGQDASGAGWSAANSLFWNCSASRIDCYKPPTAENWSYGSWAQFAGDGYWHSSNETISPRSFYYTQLADRLGRNNAERGYILTIETDASSSSPTVKQAADLTAQSVLPHIQLTEWIDKVIADHPLNTDKKGVLSIEKVEVSKTNEIQSAPEMRIQNGWIVRGYKILTGTRMEVPWWNGGVEGKDKENAKFAITRFVPGRTGKGWTDDLDEMTDSLVSQHIIGLEQHYALWYDRRRDDHERIRRMDGEVWPPFYELPFARTGSSDLAWDGLSKYDLTKYNPWYWSRLKEYARLADEKGLLLIHENYFQHNIIEAGAHYADFPWRTANNINSTGFPEPPPFAGDKRIFMADQFYDISDLNRRELHRKYIRQCLDNFKGNNGVIQLIGEEFTGPLHFVKFWLDVIKEWEKENHQQQIIGLSTTKDVQDAILADTAYAGVVNLIDIKYWHIQFDGSVYAPPGGQNLAPRQWARLLKPKRSSFEQVYNAIHDYKQKYPEKAVIYSGEGLEFGWAVLLAGGTLGVLPVLPYEFLKDAATMHVTSLGGNPVHIWALSNNNNGYIVYVDSPDEFALNVSDAKKSYLMRWIDPKTGKQSGNSIKVRSSELGQIKKETGSKASVLWVTQL